MSFLSYSRYSRYSRCSRYSRGAFFSRTVGALLPLLLLASAAHAQKAGRVRRMGEVLLTAGYGTAQIKWPTFEAFLASYNRVNAAELTAPAALARGTTQSVGILMAGCCYLGYQRTASNFEGRFTNGTTRRFEVRQGLCVVSIEPRFFIARRFFIGPTGAMVGGTSRVGISFRYPDGTESWGRETRLSGQYTGTVLAFTAGVKAGVNLGPALVQVKADYMPTGKPRTGIRDRIPSGAGLDELPTDYEAYLAGLNNPNNTFALVPNPVGYDLGGIRVAVEVGLRLNRAD